MLPCMLFCFKTAEEFIDEEDTSDIDQISNKEPHLEGMTTDDMTALQELYKSIYITHATKPEDVADSRALIDLHQYVCDIKSKQETTRTGRLWVMFMNLSALL